MRNRNDGDARLAFRGEEQALYIERLTVHPCGKAWRGEQIVQCHRELEAFLGRIESFEIERAHLVERRLLDRSNQSGEIEASSLAPCLLQHVREQDVLAALQRIGVT